MPRPREKREAALMGEKGKAEGLEPLDEKQFPLNTLKSARVHKLGLSILGNGSLQQFFSVVRRRDPWSPLMENK